MKNKYTFYNLPRRINLMDIGARGGIQYPWNNLNPDNINLILVEPDKEEAKKLEISKNDNITVIDTALWDKKEKLSLIVNKSAGTSSIYSPNIDFLKYFPDLDRFDKTKEIYLEAIDLDSYLKNKNLNIDFAKIDTQGSELNILRGAKNSFADSLIGLEVEVEFAKIYHNQPLSYEVDKYIQEELGLELWDIRKTYWKFKHDEIKYGSKKGRLIFGDALYFRSVDKLDSFLNKLTAQEQLEKLSALFVSLYLFGYLDYVFIILNKIIERFENESKLIIELKELYNLKKKNINYSYVGQGKLFKIFSIIANIFKPSYQNWGSIEENLGSKNIGPFHY